MVVDLRRQRDRVLALRWGGVEKCIALTTNVRKKPHTKTTMGREVEDGHLTSLAKLVSTHQR